MVRKSVQVEIQDVPLTTRFRKYSGSRKDKIRSRVKIDVVQIGEERFGVTIRRGVVSVKKGTVTGKGLTPAAVQSSVRKSIKTGKFDDAIFVRYEKLQTEKKTRKTTKK